MKKCIYLVLLILITLLSSCEKPRVSEESFDTTSEAISETTYNHIDLYKPDFESDQQYTYKNVTDEKLDNYIDKLTADGFVITYDEEEDIYQNVYVLKKNSIYITLIQDKLNNLHLHYIEGITEARENTKSYAKAKEIIGKEDINIIEIYIPDLYEKMNAQLFYVIQEDNYLGYSLSPAKYLIIENKAYSFSEDPPYASYYESDNLPHSHSYQPNEYIVCDIDNDLNYELLYTTFGTTSGMYTERAISCSFINGKIISRLSENIYCSYIESVNNTFEKTTDSEVYMYIKSYDNDLEDFTTNKFKIDVFDNSLSLTPVND